MLQTLACFGLKKIPLGESARNLRRSRLNFVRTSGEPGINIGAVLREDPMHMKDEDTPALECVVWKITIRVNVRCHSKPPPSCLTDTYLLSQIAEYCVFSKQQNASRCKKQCWRSKTKAEVALDAAKVVEAFLKDVSVSPSSAPTYQLMNGILLTRWSPSAPISTRCASASPASRLTIFSFSPSSQSESACSTASWHTIPVPGLGSRHRVTLLRRTLHPVYLGILSAAPSWNCPSACVCHPKLLTRRRHGQRLPRLQARCGPPRHSLRRFSIGLGPFQKARAPLSDLRCQCTTPTYTTVALRSTTRIQRGRSSGA